MMHSSSNDISAQQSPSRLLDDDIIRAFGEALREELKAGRSVRIRKLGMWTPYIGDSGKQTAAFHSELQLRKDVQNEQQKDTTMHATDVDIPFVDDTVQAHTARPPQKAPLIDVQLLFDEVREEIGLVRMPAMPAQETESVDEEAQQQDTQAPAQPEEVAPSDSAPAVDEEEIETDLPSLGAEAIQESETIFRMNRERLFNPPEPPKPQGMRRTAMVLTIIMFGMIAYMVYTSGLLNGMLPENYKYRPTPLERRMPHPAQQHGT